MSKIPKPPFRRHLEEIIQAGIATASASGLVRRALANAALVADMVAESVTVVAAGKAAQPMATAFLEDGAADVKAGLVVAPTIGDGHAVGPLEGFAGGHPVPNERSVAAGRRALELAGRLGPDDLLVVLLSGGASSLLVAPIEPLALADKVDVTDSLLRAGVPIDEVNCVRKHLSAIKGGRLAAATSARTITLAISDVVGPVPDDPAVIGSGPTSADPSSFADALRIVESDVGADRFPSAALTVLERGRRGELPDTPKPGAAAIARSHIYIIGNRLDAVRGATRAAEALGYSVFTLDAAVVGEARDAGDDYVKRAARVAYDLTRPLCIVSAGETTVRVTGSGRGGRNQEFVLGAVRALTRRFETACVASVGTDGIDGPTDAAGAVADTTSLDRAKQRGLHAVEYYLDANDAYAFFEPLGDLIRIGPTETNVGDLQVALIQ